MADDVQRLLRSIGRAWDELEGFLEGLREDEMTVPTDAGGWTIKDHLVHLSAWEDGIEGIEPPPRSEEAVNDVIFNLHRDKPLEDVLALRRAIHDRFLTTISSLADEDLARPYSSFDPASRNNQPVKGHIMGNSPGHYRKHLRWMKEIVGRA